MRLTISLDDELYRYVRARAKREDTSMSAVINELVALTDRDVFRKGIDVLLDDRDAAAAKAR